MDQIIYYYGLPIHCRLENQNGGKNPTLVLSYRTGKRKVHHELKTRKNPEIPEVGTLPETLAEEFFGKMLWIGLDNRWDRSRRGADSQSAKSRNERKEQHRTAGLALRKALTGLPLAALLAADQYTLFTNPERLSAASIDDNNRIIGTLKEYMGSTPWREVMPESCAPWMRKCSSHHREGIKRIMSALFSLQVQQGITDTNPWAGHRIATSARRLPSPEGTIRRQVDAGTLTDKQCRVFLHPIAEALHADPPRISPYDMAFLLYLTTPLSIEEICALDIGDFSPLQDFPNRLTVNITHIAQKRKKSYSWTAISDPYRVRKLPLPDFVRRVFQAYKGLQKSPHLIPKPNNATQRITPPVLKKALRKRLRNSPKQIWQETIFPNKRDLLGYRLALVGNTAKYELKKAGAEEEELRFLWGKPPLLVSAKSYADYLNECELNKLGALMDRWLGRLYVIVKNHSKDAPSKLKGKDGELTYRASGRAPTQVQLRIEIPPVTDPTLLAGDFEQGLQIELNSLYGCSGWVLFEAANDPNGQGKEEAL